MRKAFPTIIKISIILLVFGSFIYRYAFYLDSSSFHQDEHDFVERAKYFDLFFIKRDLTSQKWKDWEAYNQPPLAYYFYGLTLHLFGHKDLAKEQKETKIILEARLAAAIFSIGCLIIVYFLGKKIGGWKSGIISAVIIGNNSMFLWTMKRAMADSILLFFILATVLAVFYGVKNYPEKPKRFLFSSLLVGVLSGLAASAKLNGGMTLIIWIGVLAVTKKKNLLLMVDGLLISLIIAFNLFVFLNPYLYPDPINGSLNMINHRIEVSRGQQVMFSDSAILTLNQKINFVFKRGFASEGYINFKFPGLDLFLFSLGMCLLLAKSKLVFFAWITLTFACVTLYIPLDWDRYYLPLIPCIAIAQVYAIGSICNIILRHVKKS